MTFEIAVVLLLLVLTVTVLVKEWLSPEITAMSAFCLLMAIGILSVDDAISVFSNPAPITIGALFIITFALEKTGGLDSLAAFLRRHFPQSLSGLLLATSGIVAVTSAFINNTPIVALFMPLLLGLARARDISPSKLLIPLSYASIMGGCCTLIGTSTNIIVSGIMVDNGLDAVSMFELTKAGLPMLAIGVIYIAFITPRILPNRTSVTGVLTEDERRTFFSQLLVKKESNWVGSLLLETPVADKSSHFRIIEVRRQGATLTLPLDQITIEPNDRILISAGSEALQTDQEQPTLKPELIANWGVEPLSTLQGGIMEGVVAPHSLLEGKTIAQSNFRQQFGMLVLAVHRQGKNLKKHFKNVRLQFGDTLLLLGPQWRFDELRAKGDLMLLDEVALGENPTPKTNSGHALWAWLAIGTVVILATFDLLPIAGAAIIGAVFLLLVGVIRSEDAVRAIDWSIIFLIFGMLGVGLAMEKTGAARFLAEEAVGLASSLVPEAWLPYVALSLLLLLTSVLTEMLSNNATAAVMAPVGYNLALSLGLEPRPYMVAVMLAASLAFTTPIGYQTNTMVYNAGGYRFEDFVRAGLPLNLIYWLTASILIPIMWPFQPLN